MPPFKSESRCRIGIDWYATESEANEAAANMLANPDWQDAIAAANVGFVQCGRERAFDLKDADGTRYGFAVVTP